MRTFDLIPRIWILSLAIIAPIPCFSDVYRFVSASGEVFFSQPSYKKRNIEEFTGSHRVKSLSQRMPYPTWSGLNPSSDIGPQSKQTYEPWIQASATQHGLDPRLIHAVIQAESAYNPFAVSNKGAQGLMQLMPSTADRFGVVNPMDAGENIAGGAQYLKTLLNQFDSDLELALAAYNAGENNVIRYGKKVPPFSETQKYVQKVLEIYQGR